MAENDLNVGDGASSEPQKEVSKPIDERTIQLLSDIGGKVERFEKELHGLQSRQDKETNAFKSKMAEYDRLVKKGLEPDEAIAELDKRDKESTGLQDLQKRVEDLAKRLEGQGRPESVSQEVVSAFEELGLDTKDPRIHVRVELIVEKVVVTGTEIVIHHIISIQPSIVNLRFDDFNPHPFVVQTDSPRACGLGQ